MTGVAPVIPPPELYGHAQLAVSFGLLRQFREYRCRRFRRLFQPSGISGERSMEVLHKLKQRSCRDDNVMLNAPAFYAARSLNWVDHNVEGKTRVGHANVGARNTIRVDFRHIIRHFRVCIA